MANTQICPCIDCILIPMCRHKTYISMIFQCSIVREYIPNYNYIDEDNRLKLITIESAIQPITWAAPPKSKMLIRYSLITLQIATAKKGINQYG